MGKFRTISAEETMKCLRAYKELGNQNAFDMLVICNLARVRKIAKEFMGLGMPLMNLVSAGNEGLVLGISNYELSEGSYDNFITYLDISIRNSITNELQKFGHKNWISSLEDVIRLSQEEKEGLITTGIAFENEEESSLDYDTTTWHRN